MRAQTREDKVAEFEKIFNKSVEREWTPALFDLRKELIEEEWRELKTELMYVKYKLSEGLEITKGDKANLLKELVDLQYVISGMAVTLGLPISEAFNRVHASNMSKLDDNGNPIYREDGKVLKSKNYRAPSLVDLF